MRRVLAWILLAAGLVAGLAGAAVLTVLAPSSTIDVTVTAQDPGVAVTTAPGLLELSGSQATVHVEGSTGTEVFLAVARAADVQAWLDGAAHTEITGVAGDRSEPAAETGTSGDGAAVDPRTSDIWLTSVTGDGAAELTWNSADDARYRDAGGVVVFAATDGTADAPATTSLSWPAEGDTATHPAGIPLVVAGCVLAVIGALGILLTPRRPTARRRA